MSASPVRALLRRTATFASGNLLYAAGQFALLVLLARLGTPAMLGAYSLASAILNPMFFLSRMGMRQAQATERGKSGADTGAALFPFAVYLRLGLSLLALAAAIGLALTPLAAQGGAAALVIFLAVLAARTVEGASDIHYGLLLLNERQDIIGTSMVLRSASAVCMFLLAYLITGDAALALLGLPAGWVAIYLLHDLARTRGIVASAGRTDIYWRDVGRLLMMIWPLGVVGLLGQLGQSLPRYLVGWESGAAVLGQITPALQVHVLVVMLSQSVGQSLLPGVARDLEAGRSRRAWRRLGKVSLGLAPLVLAGVGISFVFGPALMAAIFGPGYELAGQLLGIVSVSWSFRAYGLLYQNALMGRRDFRHLLRLQVVIFALSAAAMVPGALAFGVPGALWGMAVGNAVLCGVFVLATRRMFLRSA